MFFGALNSNAALYLWDQFFMVKWNTQYIEHATRAVLYLLRDRFLYATDYDQMRQVRLIVLNSMWSSSSLCFSSKVFLEEPCLLHTADVQVAFVHLALKNDDPKFIPAMNQRFYPNQPSNVRSIDHRQMPNRRKAHLESIGIKDISLTLAIPSNVPIVSIDLWEDLIRSLHRCAKDGGSRREFDTRTIIVEVQVYGGGEKIGDVSSGSLPVLRTSHSYREVLFAHCDHLGKKEGPAHNWQRIVVDIPNDKLILSIKEARPTYTPNRIQALVIVRQRLNGKQT